MAAGRGASQPRRLDRHHGPQQGAGPPAPGIVPLWPRGGGHPHARRGRAAGDDLIRGDLCDEAVRLARLLAGLMPDEPEALGLLALLLLTGARRPARTGPDGALVLLADQDRGRWDRAMIAEGQDLVRTCLRRNSPGPYQIQAAIGAVHSDAAVAADTDWGQILVLYDQLMAVAPTPVVALNRTV